MFKNLLAALGVMLVGGVLCYAGLYEPVQEMARGDTSISVSDKMTVLGPFVVLVGIGLLVATIAAAAAGGDTRKPLFEQTRFAKLIVFVFFGLGLAAGLYAAFEWMPEQQAKYGYTRSR